MTAGQSLSDGAAGVALLHLENGNLRAAHEALHLAVDGGVSIAAGASLFYGAPALAFVLAASDHPSLTHARDIVADGTSTVTRHRLHDAHRRIDAGRRPHFAEYDLIRGLTGLGVVLRRLGHHDLLRDVLDYLVRLTEPFDGLPGWWCTNSPDCHQPPPAGGHANHGIAHGITGPLALLALTQIDGITVDGHTDAITRILRWLDMWQQTAWWPQTVTLTDLNHGIPAPRRPPRPSWCYGTPGITRAQQLAARATDDRTRQHLAETAFSHAINDPRHLRQLTDRGLCHGTAGALTTGRRIAADALTPISLAPLVSLHKRTLATKNSAAGFLDGTAGTSLADAASTLTSWDACLLIN
ncbi:MULTISPECIES: lanthionine synthetase C family protein [Catenuloplanes]|uniref:Lanthionine synthetase n=1 Tax=Catenuloplanes niger TaxID=587534 RepID=A0AAE4CPR1_9ACTN|nr:lanthionine synthetase C family protein [Catenuloplanes niger]MDR7320846.1 hypothetical protein [Catenuloplanes niger]